MLAEPSDITAARHFTRFYTRLTALLDDELLGSTFALSEARILYELATRPDPTAAALSADLGIDPGYLSRILKRFQDDGLLSRGRSEQDGRLWTLRLTDSGQAAFAGLDARSREQWTVLLAPLSTEARRALLAAMAMIEDCLGGAQYSLPGGTIRLRGLDIGDIGWIARRQGLLYAAEYGWDGTFEALVAELLAAFVRDRDPVRERAWIAERDGGVVGSVFLVRVSDEVAKLRMLYVEPSARGLGLGARLVSECITSAQALGYRELTLWTNDCLVAARRIYEKKGFRLVTSAPHRSFGKDLVGETWSLGLEPVPGGRLRPGSAGEARSRRRPGLG